MTTSKRHEPALGQFAVNFKGRHECLQEVFGSATLPVAKMQARLWEFIQAHHLLVETGHPRKPTRRVQKPR